MKRFVSVVAAAVMLAGSAAYLPQNTLTVHAKERKYGQLKYEYINDDAEIAITGCDMDMGGVELIIPSNIDGLPVTQIGNEAFRFCEELKAVTIPDSVTTIMNYVFEDCVNLESIIIPDTVTEIGDCCFNGTAWLEEKAKEKKPVIINHNLIDWRSAAGDVTVPVRVTRICGPAFQNCTEMTSFTLREGVERIGALAFYGCTGLQSVTFPETLTFIGSSAFRDCSSLKTITIPKNVTDILTCTFSGCTSLKEVKLSNVQCIGNGAFSGCSELQYIHLPKSVERIQTGAFKNCSRLCAINIPEGLKEIESSAFFGCDPVSVYFPASLEKVGESAFGNCSGLLAMRFLNPECEISEAAIYNNLAEDGIQHEYAGSILGYAGSTAQAYAEEYGYDFLEIGKKGDVYADSMIFATDAQLVLNAFLNTVNGDEHGLSKWQFASADVDGNNKLTALDAQYILTYYLYNSVLDEPTSWEEVIQ